MLKSSVDRDLSCFEIITIRDILNCIQAFRDKMSFRSVKESDTAIFKIRMQREHDPKVAIEITTEFLVHKLLSSNSDETKQFANRIALLCRKNPGDYYMSSMKILLKNMKAKMPVSKYSKELQRRIKGTNEAYTTAKEIISLQRNSINSICPIT